jgi:hypothetical protein
MRRKRRKPTSRSTFSGPEGLSSAAAGKCVSPQVNVPPSIVRMLLLWMSTAVGGEFALYVFRHGIDQLNMRGSESYAVVMWSYNILATGSLLVMFRVHSSIRARKFATALRLGRASILLFAANVALMTIAILTLTNTLRGPATFLVQHWTYLKRIGIEFTARILDYIVGGAVFEVCRRLFSRFMRPFLNEIRGPRVRGGPRHLR